MSTVEPGRAGRADLEEIAVPERLRSAGGLALARVAARVALVAFVAFLPVRDNLFVDWDDQDNFVNNADFRGLGLAQLRWAWTTTLIGVYQPLGWMILEAESAAWGLDPRGYHLFSLFLHAANAGALFVLVMAVLARAFPGGGERAKRWMATCAGLVAALYAAHPLRAEVVAWASCQPYLSCTLLSMVCVLAYLRANDVGREGTSRLGWLAASFGAFAGALLCKALAIGVPAALVALDVVPLRRLGGERGWWRDREVRRVCLEKLPFFALSALFMVIAVLAKDGAGMVVSTGHVGLTARLSLACYSAWFYPLKTLWPFDLNAYYMRPEPLAWTEPRFLVSMFAILASTAAMIVYRRKAPAILTAWVVTSSSSRRTRGSSSPADSLRPTDTVICR
jgi:hypothetical protein